MRAQHPASQPFAAIATWQYARIIKRWNIRITQTSKNEL